MPLRPPYGTAWLFITVFSCVSAFGSSSFACDFDDAPGSGLDVGVVLSGGGALAASQVGALRVIEEAGVPIHCIVGTSMGAVVAGLYASGHDAVELQT
ncbi:MAG: patatin-like phospholipase family protein, partial [Oricola sp.]|nr:patatin-like phospholipase family protein [Oricola sp.]